MRARTLGAMLVLASAMSTAGAHAGAILFGSTDRHHFLQQTSETQVDLLAATLLASVFATSTEYDPVVLSGPGAIGSLTLPRATGFYFGFAPVVFTTEDLQANFELGTYTLTLTSPTETLVATYEDTVRDFPPPPSLAGDGFTRLQGVDTRLPLTLQVGNASPSGTADLDALTLVAIDSGRGVFHAFERRADDPTLFDLPAFTLAPDTAYTFDIRHSLIYTSNLMTTGVLGSFSISRSASTQGAFRTAAASAVPEPHASALMMLGLFALGALRRLRA